MTPHIYVVIHIPRNTIGRARGRREGLGAGHTFLECWKTLPLLILPKS